MQTREKIVNAAMSLFLSKGFDAATVEEIAQNAEVSKRTFFDYFPAKEDVVFAWQDRFGSVLAAAVRARPAGEPLMKVMEEAFVASIAAVSSPESIAIDMLVRTTPALSARSHLKYRNLENTLAEVLLERVDEADGLRARLLAMVMIGGLRVATDGSWHMRNAKTDPATFTRMAFHANWAILFDLAKSAIQKTRSR